MEHPEGALAVPLSPAALLAMEPTATMAMTRPGPESGPRRAPWDTWGPRPTDDVFVPLEESAAVPAGHGGWDPLRDDHGGLARLLQQLHERHAAVEAGAVDPDDVDPRKESFFSDAGLPDVLASAEDLKALLMAPFVHEPVNLLVHRVGRTMLIESADTVAGKARDGPKPKGPRPKLRPCPSAPAAEGRKLRYYSIMAEEAEEAAGAKGAEGGGGPCPESGGMVGPTAEHRALQWRFDDLSIFVGGATPLAQTAEGPNPVALQLHDAARPVSRADTLSWWLDNVLMRAASVAVVFHRDGEVQGCRVVPTDDIPDLDASAGFEPLAVKHHARNVLKWLQGSCRRDAGSYVVLKEPGSGAMRLFDLNEIRKGPRTARSPQPSSPRPMSPRPEASPVSRGRTGRWPALPNVDEPLFADPTTPLVPLSKGDHTAALLDIDDDTPPSPPRREPSPPERSPPRAETEFGRAFDHPVGMMCFRMAQCLGNADAETLRLLLRALALLPGADTDHRLALVRATGHAQCAQHYHASSPLADSEQHAVRHAAAAVRELAVVFRAKDDAGLATPHDDGRTPHAVAVALCSALLSLLCGVAAHAVQERRYLDMVSTAAIAQGALYLRRDCIPSGLLVPAAIAPPPSTVAGRPPKQKLPAPAPTAPDDDGRGELFAAVAALHGVAGDWMHCLMDDVAGAEAERVAAPHDPVAGQVFRDKRRLIELLRHEARRRTADVMADVLVAGLPLHEPPVDSAAELPDSLNILGLVAGAEVRCRWLFEAGLAAYHRAVAHLAPQHALTHGTTAVLRRKVAGLHNQYAATRARVAQQTDDKAQGAEARLDAAETFAAAAELFTAEDHPANTLLAAINAAQMRLGLARLAAETADDEDGPLGDEEEGHLVAACRTLGPAVEHFAFNKQEAERQLRQAAEVAVERLCTVHRVLGERHCAVLRQPEPAPGTGHTDERLAELERAVAKQHYVVALRAAQQARHLGMELRSWCALAALHGTYGGVEDCCPDGLTATMGAPWVQGRMMRRPASQRLQSLHYALSACKGAVDAAQRLFPPEAALQAPAVQGLPQPQALLPVLLLMRRSDVAFAVAALHAADHEEAARRRVPQADLRLKTEAQAEALQQAMGALHDAGKGLGALCRAAAGGECPLECSEAVGAGRALQGRLSQLLLRCVKLSTRGGDTKHRDALRRAYGDSLADRPSTPVPLPKGWDTQVCAPLSVALAVAAGLQALFPTTTAQRPQRRR